MDSTKDEVLYSFEPNNLQIPQGKPHYHKLRFPFHYEFHIELEVECFTIKSTVTKGNYTKTVKGYLLDTKL